MEITRETFSNECTKLFLDFFRFSNSKTSNFLGLVSLSSLNFITSIIFAKGILLVKIAYRKNVLEAAELAIAIIKLAFVNVLKDTLELIVAKELWDSLKVSA